MTNQQKYEQMEVRKANALLVAGELAGLALHLDVEALEKFLENAPSDFKYTKLAKAALEFAKVIV